MNTKKFVTQFIMLSVVVLLTACTGGKKDNNSDENNTLSNKTAQKESSAMHKEHKNLSENFTHKDIVLLDKVYIGNEIVEKRMKEIVDEYLMIKEFLTKEDVDAVDKRINSMIKKVKGVPHGSLQGKGLEAWLNHRDLYVDKLNEMQHINDLQSKRSYFGHISEILYCTIKSFGLQEGNLYAAYCPMAFNNKGAYWITNTRDIKNPYMGKAMASCGEIREKL